MNNQLEQSLLKWLKDELSKTDKEFGEFQTNRNTMETAGVLSKEDEEFFTNNINRLRFRYRWLEAQISEIKSFNKK